MREFGSGLRHLLEWKKGFVLAGFLGGRPWIGKKKLSKIPTKNTFSKRLIKCQFHLEKLIELQIEN
jgi:hypothetical protein